LDLGRTRRLFSPAQRKAMRWRDQHCRAEGCTIPAGWCEAHHLDPWANGGNTDLDRGVLLCSWHHHRAHDPTHTAEKLPNGDIRFHRRT
ncbi:HNH endonuclease, partial [Nocardioides silvaticus]